MNSFTLLETTRWKDYALLDSGDGLKLERFGKYVFARPESQAMWKRALTSEWKNADAVFISTGEESGGHWDVKRKVEGRGGVKNDLFPPPLPPPPGERGILALLGNDNSRQASWSLS
ncbi:MAG TPA: hypothetical protein PKE62_09960 [Anaerolineales bacterium]|nr:hypothetical protein [Anaerolineales bacterium]